MVPHGQSVSLTAPEAFRFSFDSRAGAAPAGGRAAGPGRGASVNDQREQLPSVLVALMRDIGIPNGIGGVGYTEADVPDLVPGHDEAAAPAGHLPAPADRGRHRRHPHPVRRELVNAGGLRRRPRRRPCAARSGSTRGTRAMYSADASNYRRVPIGVVAPVDADDVAAAVAVCRAHDVPVLPRGAGTSHRRAGRQHRGGAGLHPAHERGRWRSTRQARTARVQPGVVLDDAARRGRARTG